MHASMLVRVEGDRVVDLHADPPLGAKIRSTSAGPELHLVTTAASLLEGDVLSIEVRLGPGARLTVRSVAAQVAHPCLGGGRTELHLCASVDDGALLRWSPEPTIVCEGADHLAATRVTVMGSGRVAWDEELVLGRSGEDRTALRLETLLCADRDGTPVLEDGLLLAPGWADAWAGPAVLGDAGYLGTRLLLEVGSSMPTDPVESTMWTSLAAGGALQRVVDADPMRGRAAFTARACARG